MKISLIATVKDAADHIGDFLTSVRAQTRPPDEIVIVDGGSTDGTIETLRGAADVELIEVPGANIARGRNVAIDAATHDVIAVSDADCVLAPDWLARLERALEDGAEVAMGFSRPLATTFFEICSSAVSLPERSEVDPERYLPSSRSIAFRRDVVRAAGGYPEWLDIGEDMYLNLRLREAGVGMAFVPEAVTYWRVRPTVGTTWRQYFRYAEGDGRAGMHPQRHALRFGVYALAALAVVGRRRRLRRMLAVAGAAYAARPVTRAWRRLPEPRQRAAAVAAVPALMLLADAAKIAGYLSGRRSRR